VVVVAVVVAVAAVVAVVVLAFCYLFCRLFLSKNEQKPFWSEICEICLRSVCKTKTKIPCCTSLYPELQPLHFSASWLLPPHSIQGAPDVRSE
jgi:hypothetical protein